MFASISGGSVRSSSNGPPGAACTIKKASTITNSNVGIAPNSRSRAYRSKVFGPIND
jgi:hypothetical protein